MNTLIRSNRTLHALLCSAFFALSCVALTSTSFAQSTAQTQSADLHGQFKRLELSKQRGKMSVSYKLTKSSWRSFKQARVEPRLNIYLPNGTRYEYAYSVRLPKRKATITLPKMNLRGVRDAEVRLVGFEGAYRIASVGLGKTKARRLRVALVRQGAQGQVVQTQPPVQNGRAQIIAACKANTRYNSELNDCITRALKLRGRRAPQVVHACGKGTAYHSGFQQCLTLAARVPGNKVDAVTVCAEASSYDSGLTKCLTRVGAIKSSDPVALVRACGKVTSYDSGAEECIRTAGVSKGPMAPAVLACGAHTSYDSEVKSCLIATQPLAVAPAPVVRACGKHTKYSSDMNTCIKHAGSLVAGQEGVVHACGQATQYGSGFNQCIKTAAARRVGSSIVTACGDSTRYDSEVAQCIVNSSQPRKRGGRVRQASYNY